MSEHENPDKTVKILNTSRSEKISLTNKNQYKKINENNSEPIEEITDKQSRINKRDKEEFHFQTKLRNSGFWGKVSYVKLSFLHLKHWKSIIFLIREKFRDLNSLIEYTPVHLITTKTKFIHRWNGTTKLS